MDGVVKGVESQEIDARRGEGGVQPPEIEPRRDGDGEGGGPQRPPWIRGLFTSYIPGPYWPVGIDRSLP